MSPTEIQILRDLDFFTYLTPKQMLRLETAKHKRHLYQVLRAMEGKKLIQSIDHGPLPGGGRLETIWYLRKAGAEAIAEHDDHDIALYPRSSEPFQNDYQHRINTVSAHIEIELAVQPDFFRAYFDGSGPAYRYSKGSLRPDGVFAFTIEGVTRLCALEVYNGHRTKRIEEQIEKYRLALQELVIETAHEYKAGVRVLCYFDSMAGEERVRKRLEPLKGDAIRHQLFFKCLGEGGAFHQNWRTLTRIANLY